MVDARPFAKLLVERMDEEQRDADARAVAQDTDPMGRTVADLIEFHIRCETYHPYCRPAYELHMTAPERDATRDERERDALANARQLWSERYRAWCAGELDLTLLEVADVLLWNECEHGSVWAQQPALPALFRVHAWLGQQDCCTTTDDVRAELETAKGRERIREANRRRAALGLHSLPYTAEYSEDAAQ